jgi:hypothetical protein
VKACTFFARSFIAHSLREVPSQVADELKAYELFDIKKKYLLRLIEKKNNSLRYLVTHIDSSRLSSMDQILNNEHFVDGGSFIMDLSCVVM